MTRQRRLEIEARLIANRKHEPEAFAVGPVRGDWSRDTRTAPATPVYHASETYGDTTTVATSPATRVRYVVPATPKPWRRA